jgi:type IV secretory pathway TraG/TraD family ATPase VirD4
VSNAAFTAAGLALSLAGLAIYSYLRVAGRLRTADSHGDSRWAHPRDLRPLTAAGNLGSGIVLGWLGRRLLHAPPEDNVLVFGVQRSGKTSTLAIPTLVEWSGAAVVTSTKDELVALTARHRAGLGPVHVFAPLDRDTSWVSAMGLSTVSWNPLDEISDSGDAAELADLFTASGKGTQSAHWYYSAANLLTALFLLHSRGRGDIRRVLSIINQTPLLGYLALAGTTDGDARELLLSIAATPEREAGSIISTARSSLSLWLDPRVANATASTPGLPLNLGEMLSSSSTLYLVAPAEDAERCRLLFSALLGALLRRATSRARLLGGTLTPRLLLALDEAANFARLPRLASYVSTGPGQGIQSLLCFHDLAQLEAGYGAEQARTVWNNCRARLLLPGQGDLKTLELFSRAMGQETVVYEQVSHARGSDTVHHSHTGRALRSIDGLRRSRQAVLVYANAPPARLEARRWDQVPAWRSAIDRSRASPAQPAA